MGAPQLEPWIFAQAVARRRLQRARLERIAGRVFWIVVGVMIGSAAVVATLSR